MMVYPYMVNYGIATAESDGVHLRDQGGGVQHLAVVHDGRQVNHAIALCPWWKYMALMYFLALESNSHGKVRKG